MIIKLRNRLIATIMAFISIIMLVAFASIYMVTYIRTYNENTEKVNSTEEIKISSDGQMIFEGEVITNAFVVNRISPALGVYFNLVTNAYGNVVLVDSALNLEMDDYEAAAMIATNNPNSGITEFSGRKWQYISVAPEDLHIDLNASTTLTDLTFVRFLDVTESYKTLETLLVTLAGLYVVLLVIFYVLARFFAARAVAPMAEAWENQRQFIADASHELKTPISTLNANLDILYASQDDTIREQVRWLDNSKTVLTRMMTLIQSMLELAKVDESDENYQLEDVSISHLLNEVADSYIPLANKKNISIIEDVAADAFLHSNHGMIQQIVEILMDNAVKYTNDGGQIQVSAFSEKGGAVIKVQNTGEGISPTDIDKIFDRFYRGDKSRVYKEGNYGLGLSIAKSTVQKLGGEISVQGNSMHTIFIVRIPSKKQRHS